MLKIYEPYPTNPSGATKAILLVILRVPEKAGPTNFVPSYKSCLKIEEGYYI